MHRQKDCDLLEPFPSTARRVHRHNLERETSLYSLFQTKFLRHDAFFHPGGSESDLNENQDNSIYAMAEQGSTPTSSRIQDLDDSFRSDHNHDPDCRYDPISVASIVGDHDEFHKLQLELRNSKMLTGAGTHQILKGYIDSRGREIKERRSQDPVKCLAPPPTTTESKKSCVKLLSKRLSSIMQNLDKYHPPTDSRALHVK
jgi:hypothetical protein